MKFRIILPSILTFLITSQTFAQAPAQTPTVTNQELMKYATVMDSVNEMSASAKIKLTEILKGSTVMNATRYNELNRIINDPAQLEAAKATPQEIEFVKDVSAKQKDEVNRINSTYQSLAKDYVTPAVFNKVKKALTSDPLLKHRYDSLMTVLGKDDPRIQQ
jgi:hypothetical protein